MVNTEAAEAARAAGAGKKAAGALDRVITWILYALIACLPAVIGRGVYEATLPPKVTALRVAAALLLLLWAASCALAGELKWRRTRLDLPLAGLLAAVTVSTVFSMNWQASLAGSIRQEGLWIYFIYALVFYLSAWYLGRDGKWLTALRLTALSSAVPALMTGLQLCGADLSRLLDARTTPYAAAFGYRPYYAYYLVLVIPVFFYLASREPWRKGSRWKRAAWAAGGAANLAVLPLTNNRASTLGFFSAALAVVILLGLRSRRRRRVILTGLGILALAAVLLAGLSWDTTYGKRLRSAASFTSDGNASARLSMWRSSLRMMADRPVQGFGLESFYYDYYRYIEDGFHDRVAAVSRDFAYDNPHNQALYVGVSTGVGGLLCYLLLHALLFTGLYRAFREEEDPWFYGAVFCAALANFVSVQFLYDLPPYTFYLWVLAGTALGRLGEGAETEAEAAAAAQGPSPAPGTPRRAGLRTAAGLLALALAAAVSVYSAAWAVRFQAADRVMEAARRDAGTGRAALADLSPAIEKARRGASLDPLSVSFRPDIYEMLLYQAGLTGSDDPNWELVGVAERHLRYFPTDPRSWTVLGWAYAHFYEATGREEYREEAAGFLERALLLHPRYQAARDIIENL